MKKYEKITIRKHGSEYEEPEELYRFQCCPECISGNTEVDYSDSVNGAPYYHSTGYTYKKRIGIFDGTFVYVNHKCNDCGCLFSDEYEDKSKRRCMEVDDRVSFVVILGLVLVLLVFSTVLSVSVEITDFVVLWFCASLVGSIAVGLVLLWCLIDALL